ncbi:MAG TPA: hypothetical protein VLL98_05410 [Rickettsiales bacterium]|nr:hypothetical protein [Rickettsiales bacterium]
MGDLMKDDFMKKLCDSQGEVDLKKKFEKNNAINADMVEPIKRVLMYYVENNIEIRNDIIHFRTVLNYIIKTGGVRYDEGKKYDRLSRILDRIKKFKR